VDSVPSLTLGRVCFFSEKWQGAGCRSTFFFLFGR
jgi:hypothetical protein